MEEEEEVLEDGRFPLCGGENVGGNRGREGGGAC